MTRLDQWDIAAKEVKNPWKKRKKTGKRKKKRRNGKKRNGSPFKKPSFTFFFSQLVLNL